MQCYRRLTEIKAISFDLDDTLYSNRPIMQAIEAEMTAYFAVRFSALLPEVKETFNRNFWAPYRQQAIKINQDVAHDVVRLRFESYRLGLTAYKLSAEIAEQEAQAGLDYFIHLRSDFSVPRESLELLEILSKKYPLVAISNGNVDTNAIGIAKYFTHIYHAGFKGQSLLKMKPATDMFDKACQQLAILPEQLLHVGDCGVADIHGALNAGCQSAFLSKYGVGKPLKQLPHIALTNVSQLRALVNLR